MNHNRLFNRCLACALILIAGIGLALVLPWLASSQALAARSEIAAQDNAPKAPTIYYVAITGTGLNPTVEWSGAFTNVQDALAMAVDPSEIWVAKGVYYPDVGIGQIDNSPTATFLMTDGVALYGGFKFGDTDFSDRDWEINHTVLSGDIDGNDTHIDGIVLTTSGITGNNAYHVITANGVSGTAVLDGFTITAGQADGDFEPDDYGGGFYCNGAGINNVCNPTLSNLNFSGNFAYRGGAIYNDGSADGFSSPKLSRVEFSGNKAEYYGGAIYNDGEEGASSPFLSNITFSENTANDDGGAIYNDGTRGTSSPNLMSVNFTSNSAAYFGGAMYNNGYEGASRPLLVNAAFSGNYSGWEGGAIYNYGYKGNSSPILINVTFSGNSAVGNGGAMYNRGQSGISSPEVYNSILWNNQDSSGTGIISATIFNEYATVTLTHSLVQGTGGSSSWTTNTNFVDGGDNIDKDPIFVTPVNPSNAPTTSGNLRLKSNSPAVDAGNNDFVATVTTDLDGEPRIVDGDNNGTPTVDMGAYEYIEYTHEGYLPLIIR